MINGVKNLLRSGVNNFLKDDDMITKMLAGGAIGATAGIALASMSNKSYLESRNMGALGGVAAGLLGSRTMLAKSVRLLPKTWRAVDPHINTLSKSKMNYASSFAGAGILSSSLFAGQKLNYYDNKSRGLNSKRGYKI